MTWESHFFYSNNTYCTEKKLVLWAVLKKKNFFIQMASWLRPGANCEKEKKKYLVWGSQFFLGSRFLTVGGTKFGEVSISCHSSSDQKWRNLVLGKEDLEPRLLPCQHHRMYHICWLLVTSLNDISEIFPEISMILCCQPQFQSKNLNVPFFTLF